MSSLTLHGRHDDVSIKAVLFDFGMVLCGPPNKILWKQMCATAGFEDPVFQREYWAHRHLYDRGTYTGQTYWQLVAAGNGMYFSQIQMKELITADVHLWTDPNPDMLAWVKRLQHTSIRTGILSNIGDAMEAGVRAKFNWLCDFDHCTWSHTLKLAKPEIAIYQHAAEGLATQPHNILFIDDRIENIEAAKEFGMQAIQYCNHLQFVEEMKSHKLAALLTP